MVASGGKLGEANAAKSLAETLVTRFPRKSFWLKKRQTSGIMKWPAMIKDPNRLSVASFWSSNLEGVSKRQNPRGELQTWVLENLSG